MGEKEIGKRTGKRKTNKNRKRKDMIKRLKQAVAELGQAQLKLRLGFTLTKFASN